MEKLALTEAEGDQVDRLVGDLIADGERWNLLDLVDRVVVAAQRLPDRIRELMAAARSGESDVTVLSGLPIAPDLAPTPTGWEAAAKTGAGLREEMVLLLCGSALGDPFGWVNQQDGRVVHDVCPTPGMESSMTSASSRTALSLHTEDIFHPCRGDYVSLLCLRNPDLVATTYVRVDAVTLPADVAEVLSQQRFRFYPDDSHVGAVFNLPDGEDHLAGRSYTSGSVLFGPSERPYLRFDVDFMAAEDDDAEARQAIDVAAAELASSVERVVLHPGDAVFLDNYRVVHGREPFRPRYDGRDRWLKRVNLLRDVRRIYASSDRRSRLLAWAPPLWPGPNPERRASP